MRCREWAAELTDWALEELPPAKVRELEEHLKQCEECAGAAQRLQGVRQALSSSLADRAMPGHLVFVGEKPRSRFANFWPALLRTAALSAAAAAVFVAVASVGMRYGGPRLLAATALGKPALTRTEVEAMVSQAVSAKVEAATRNQMASLRREQTADWERLARQLQVLELAESSEWKETQRQSEMISLVAHSQQLPANSPAEH